MRRNGQWDVLAGILSPVHDAYGKKDLLPGVHRVAMCRLAVASSKWILVDDWETRQAGWTRTRDVLDYYEKAINIDNPRTPPSAPSAAVPRVRR